MEVEGGGGGEAVHIASRKRGFNGCSLSIREMNEPMMAIRGKALHN